MNESNNVRFAEADGKWLWKRYDENGSVTFRSPLFNTEREAREDYDMSGDRQDEAKQIIEGAKEIQIEQIIPDRSGTSDTTIASPENENTAGTATNDESQDKQPEDNSAGQATI